jgi:hypothetical protein
MEMAVRSMETVETVMETDGDGSGGTSPSRQGARTEASIPRNLASTAVALRNCSRNFVDSFRVFCPEALYRQRGDVGSGPRPPHTMAARPGPGLRQPGVRAACGPSPTPLRISRSFRKK